MDAKDLPLSISSRYARWSLRRLACEWSDAHTHIVGGAQRPPRYARHKYPRGQTRLLFGKSCQSIWFWRGWSWCNCWWGTGLKYTVPPNFEQNSSFYAFIIIVCCTDAHCFVSVSIILLSLCDFFVSCSHLYIFGRLLPYCDFIIWRKMIFL